MDDEKMGMCIEHENLQTTRQAIVVTACSTKFIMKKNAENMYTTGLFC